ncbi:Methyltransferase [Hexamita inflata]|uniref:Methyltransferase n=1 Tax=Hexamita inflata TaxID=28002 RepID=A0AA86RGK3_9EUKA|nr:Methyltransferase [Hexamita inflata]
MKDRPANNLKTKVAPAIKKAKPIEQQIDDPQNFEDQYVHKVYESISDHFSSTRQVPWPLIQVFLRNLPTGSFVLDDGCGNGKYLKHPHLNIFGLDYSHNLATIASASAPTLTGDALSLPFKSSVFDGIISVAVIHHFVSEQRRLQSLQEMFRVTTPGARVLVSVWAFEQNLSAQDNFIPWSQQIDNSAHFCGQKEAEITEVNRQKCVIQNRFYHFFVKGELSALGKQAGFQVDAEIGRKIYGEIYGEAAEEEEYFDHDNWYCVFKK